MKRSSICDPIRSVQKELDDFEVQKSELILPLKGTEERRGWIPGMALLRHQQYVAARRTHPHDRLSEDDS